MVESREGLSRVSMLLAASSSVPSMSLRALYLAEARAALVAEEKRLAETRRLLEAAEIELERVIRNA